MLSLINDYGACLSWTSLAGFALAVAIFSYVWAKELTYFSYPIGRQLSFKVPLHLIWPSCAARYYFSMFSRKGCLFRYCCPHGGPASTRFFVCMVLSSLSFGKRPYNCFSSR